MILSIFSFKKKNAKIGNFLFCFFCLHGLISFVFAQEQKLKISVSIPPLTFFVQQIAGDRAQIFSIVPKQKNPEMYEPDFSSTQHIMQSDIFVGIGMPFEKTWLPRILNTAKNSHAPYLIELDKDLHSHSMHLWLSINNAKKITQILCDELIKYNPNNASYYRDNAQKLLDSLDKLKVKIMSIIERMPNKDFIVYHPILDIFDKEYGLSEHALQQHGKKYGVKDILVLSELGKKLRIKRVFTESKNQDIISLAKYMNAEVIVINPLSEDYLNNVESIFLMIAKSYE